MPRYLEPRYYVALIAVGEVLIAAVLYELLTALPLRLTVAELPVALYLLPHSLLLLGLTISQMSSNQAVDVALGRISQEAYLTVRIRPYGALAWINHHTPPGTPIALVGVSRGYYLDRPYLADWYGQQLNALEAGGATRSAAFAIWCRTGVRFAVFDRGNDAFDIDQAAMAQPLPDFTWIHTKGLRPHLLYSNRGVDVLEVQPCSAQEPPNAHLSIHR